MAKVEEHHVDYVEALSKTNVKVIKMEEEMKKIVYRLRNGGKRFARYPRRTRRIKARTQTYFIRNGRT